MRGFFEPGAGSHTVFRLADSSQNQVGQIDLSRRISRLGGNPKPVGGFCCVIVAEVFFCEAEVEEEMRALRSAFAE